jgi:hypothetical protein
MRHTAESHRELVERVARVRAASERERERSRELQVWSRELRSLRDARAPEANGAPLPLLPH